LHIFANLVTPFGTAANNRARNEGNITTLQKLLWQGETHSTVSAEAIRFALRRLLAAAEKKGTNRTRNESAQPKPRNEWKDPAFEGWATSDGAVYIDDDLLGFMSAQAAVEDGAGDATEQGAKKKKTQGTVTLRRGTVEVTRGISLTPWAGDVTFNATTPGSNLGGKDKNQPGLYGTEEHATRYQYGVAITPERLRDKSRAARAVEALCNLGTVAGNHGRFLFDFSPEAVVFRVTADPAPRLLYCFDTHDDGATVSAPRLAARVLSGDIDPNELIVAGVELLDAERNRIPGVKHCPGVKAACAEAIMRINQQLGLKG